MKLAIVGYGKIAGRHREVFESLGASIVGSCNRSPEGRARAADAGVPATFATPEEMVDAVQPDALLCTTSIHENHAAALRISPLGLPVLLEKPAAMSNLELDSLIAVTQEHGTKIQVGLNRLHYTVLAQAIDDAGGVDSITSVDVDWSERPSHLAGRGFSEEQIAQRNCSNSIHGLCFLTHLAGEIIEPDLTIVKRGEPFRWLMSLTGVSERGVFATFKSNWETPIPWRLRFTTAERVYTFQPLESCVVKEVGNDDRALEPDAVDAKFKPGLYRQAQQFIKVVRGAPVPEHLSPVGYRPTLRLAEALTTILEAP